MTTTTTEVTRQSTYADAETEEQTRFRVEYADELTIKHEQRVVGEPRENTRQRVSDAEVDKQEAVRARRPVLSDSHDVVSSSHGNKNRHVSTGSDQCKHRLGSETSR